MNQDIHENSHQDVNPELQDAPVDRLAEEHAQAATNARKLKRKILIGILVIIVFAAVSIPLISLIDNTGNIADSAIGQAPSRPTSVIWATPDYDRTINIREDPDYLKLKRMVFLKQDNREFGITESDLDEQTPAVRVLFELVNTLIDGDADTYNALFSERYYTKNGGEAEDPFTMQRVYDIHIEEIRVRLADNETPYTEYIYALEYKINRNDGTYRVDIGHDASRTQYFVLTDREGDVKIDRLVYMNTKYS